MGNLVEEGEEGLKGPEKSRTPQESLQSQLTGAHRGSQTELPELQAWNEPRLPAHIQLTWSSVFMWVSELLAQGLSLTLLPSFGTLSPNWDTLSTPSRRRCTYSYCSLISQGGLLSTGGPPPLRRRGGEAERRGGRGSWDV